MTLLSTIGPYEVKAEIGHGSLARVYLAYDRRYQREVALKAVFQAEILDLQLFARLKRELELVRMIGSPSILNIYEVEQQDGYLFIAMHYLVKGSLADRLKLGALPVAEVAQIINSLAPALDAVHALDIVHRDLKPSNILFGEEGVAQLADFGMVKIAEAITRLPASTLLGPTAYLSPEQARNATHVDGRADIYSLGAIVYEMLTGQPPFQATSALGMAVRQIIDPVPNLSIQASGLPPGCDLVVAQAMDKDPARRFATAGELALSLTAAAGGKKALPGINRERARELAKRNAAVHNMAASSIARLPTASHEYTHSPPPAQRRWTWVWLGLALVVLLGAFTVFRNLPQGKQALAWLPWNAPPTPVIAPVTEVVILPTSEKQPPTPTFTPSPSPIQPLAVTSTPPPTQIPTATPTLPLPITPSPTVVKSPTVSPSPTPAIYRTLRDDTLFDIASKAGVDLRYLMGINTDLKCTTNLSLKIREINIPPQNREPFVFADVPLNADTAASLAELDYLECVDQVRDASFSVDGKILAVAQKKFIDFWQIDTMTPHQRLKGHTSPVQALAFSPDGVWLASGDNSGIVHLWTVEDEVLLPVEMKASGPVTDLAFSHDSRLLVATSQGQAVRVWSLPEGTPVALPTRRVGDPDNFLTGYPTLSVAFSPDGKFLAIGFGNAVVLYDPQNLTLLRILTPSSEAHNLAFSHDSLLLASNTDVWAVQEPDFRLVFSMQKGPHTVAFTPDDALLLVGHNIFNLWDYQPLRPLESIHETTSTTYDQEITAVHPSSQLLAWGTRTHLYLVGFQGPVDQPPPSQDVLHVMQNIDTYFNVAGQYNVGLAALLDRNNLQCSSVYYAGKKLYVPTALSEADLSRSQGWMPLSAQNASRIQKLSEMDTRCQTWLGQLTFSSDGQSVASGPAFWNIARASILAQEQNPALNVELASGVREPAQVIVFSPTAPVAAARAGNDVHLWDTSTGRLLRTLSGHQDTIFGLAFSRDGRILASSSNDGQVRLWDVENGARAGEFSGVVAKKLAFVLDDSMLMAGWEDTSLHFIPLKDPLDSRPLNGINGDSALSPDRRFLAYIMCEKGGGAQCSNQVANLYRIQDDKTFATFTGLQQLIQSIEFSPDGKKLLVASDYSIVEWDIDGRDKVGDFVADPQGRKKIRDLTFSPNGSLLIVVTEDGQARFFAYPLNFDQPELLTTLDIKGYKSFAFSPDGTRFGVTGQGQVLLYGVRP